MRGNIFSTAYMLSNVIAVMIVYLCILKPAFGRMCISILFIGASIVNTVIAISHPRLYLTYADVAAVPLYVQFINGFFSRHITTIVLSIATAQFIIGGLLIWKGTLEKFALGGATMFLVAIAPLGAGSSFPSSLLLALACLLLMREKEIKPWPETLFHIKSDSKKIIS
ncbi:hypothetical protein SAMN05428949_0518 [Chitinophaga sp. YR627]|uniref:hypothetical protein n=1 Tax=Chitinophaga sp. YR627 TaxID=1881041 RepID=UPI0008F37131|nr:hypothetical protein [Chitinophaga sp. YR627]SFM71064.1 hypothetical protein SAMN05428949_0518 [Chitinophaga sp. YR627]